MPEWVPVAASTDVAPGAIVDAAHDDELVVWRSADGIPCVMDARCPHQWSHLGAEGAVDGNEIVCTSHWWRFDVTGRGCRLRSDGSRDPQADITVIPCEERNGHIWIAAG